MLYKNIFIRKVYPAQFYEIKPTNWISGFITGEGSFTQNSRNNCFIFNIEQAEREVLDYIKCFFVFGPKVCTKKKRQNRKQTYAIQISSKKDLLCLIDFIQNKHNNSSFVSICGYKRTQFLLWLDCFNQKHNL